jgi:hypothetical protein
MSVEQLVEWEEVLTENLPQRHFVKYKSHMTWLGVQPGPQRWEPGDLWHGPLFLMGSEGSSLCTQGLAIGTCPQRHNLIL